MIACCFYLVFRFLVPSAKKYRRRTLTVAKKICAERLESNGDRSNFDEEAFMLEMEHFLPGVLYELVRKYKAKWEGKSIEWPDTVKEFAISMSSASPSGYGILSEYVELPVSEEIANWVGRFEISPGFCEPIFDSLKETTTDWDKGDRDVSLLVGTTLLKPSLYYTIKRDKVVGFVDFGDGHNSRELAVKVLILMIRGIRIPAKQPIGYFLCPGEVCGEKLKAIWIEAINKLIDIGLTPRALVCDLNKSNIQCFQHLGVSNLHPFFSVRDITINCVIDPSYLLRCTRNVLRKKNIMFGDCVAKWDDINDFYELDLKRHYRLAPNLTKAHIHPSRNTRLKVSLAAQVFSSSVALGIETDVVSGNMEASAMGTSKFIKNLGKLFDALNSQEKNEKPVNCPIFEGSIHFEFLQKSVDWLSSIVIFDKVTNQIETTKYRFVNGWIQSIGAIWNLWSQMKDQGYNCLQTRRISKDPLENFIRQVRNKGNPNRTIQVSQFMDNFRQLCIQELIEPAVGDDIEDDDDDPILEYNSLRNAYIYISPVLHPDFEDSVLKVDAEDLSESTSYFYVVSAVLKTLESLHAPCEICEKHYFGEEMLLSVVREDIYCPENKIAVFFKKLDNLITEDEELLYSNRIVGKLLDRFSESKILLHIPCLMEEEIRAARHFFATRIFYMTQLKSSLLV